jgi:hypothetical protein
MEVVAMRLLPAGLAFLLSVQVVIAADDLIPIVGMVDYDQEGIYIAYADGQVWYGDPEPIRPITHISHDSPIVAIEPHSNWEFVWLLYQDGQIWRAHFNWWQFFADVSRPGANPVAMETGDPDCKYILYDDGQVWKLLGETNFFRYTYFDRYLASVPPHSIPEHDPPRLQIHPSPATPESDVAISLTPPALGAVDLLIVDSSGRQVLAWSSAANQAQVFHWDGKDAMGDAVHSGRYFIQASAHGSVVASSLLLIR